MTKRDVTGVLAGLVIVGLLTIAGQHGIAFLVDVIVATIVIHFISVSKD